MNIVLAPGQWSRGEKFRRLEPAGDLPNMPDWLLEQGADYQRILEKPRIKFSEAWDVVGDHSLKANEWPCGPTESRVASRRALSSSLPVERRTMRQ